MGTHLGVAAVHAQQRQRGLQTQRVVLFVLGVVQVQQHLRDLAQRREQDLFVRCVHHRVQHVRQLVLAEVEAARLL